MKKDPIKKIKLPHGLSLEVDTATGSVQVLKDGTLAVWVDTYYLESPEDASSQETVYPLVHLYCTESDEPVTTLIPRDGYVLHRNVDDEERFVDVDTNRGLETESNLYRYGKKDKANLPLLLTQIDTDTPAGKVRHAYLAAVLAGRGD